MADTVEELLGEDPGDAHDVLDSHAQKVADPAPQRSWQRPLRSSQPTGDTPNENGGADKTEHAGLQPNSAWQRQSHWERRDYGSAAQQHFTSSRTESSSSWRGRGQPGGHAMRAAVPPFPAQSSQQPQLMQPSSWPLAQHHLAQGLSASALPPPPPPAAPLDACSGPGSLSMPSIFAPVPPPRPPALPPPPHLPSSSNSSRHGAPGGNAALDMPDIMGPTRLLHGGARMALPPPPPHQPLGSSAGSLMGGPQPPPPRGPPPSGPPLQSMTYTSPTYNSHTYTRLGFDPSLEQQQQQVLPGPPGLPPSTQPVAPPPHSFHRQPHSLHGQFLHAKQNNGLPGQRAGGEGGLWAQGEGGEAWAAGLLKRSLSAGQQSALPGSNKWVRQDAGPKSAEELERERQQQEVILQRRRALLEAKQRQAGLKAASDAASPPPRTPGAGSALTPSPSTAPTPSPRGAAEARHPRSALPGPPAPPGTAAAAAAGGPGGSSSAPPARGEGGGATAAAAAAAALLKQQEEYMAKLRRAIELQEAALAAKTAGKARPAGGGQAGGSGGPVQGGGGPSSAGEHDSLGVKVEGGGGEKAAGGGEGVGDGPSKKRPRLRPASEVLAGGGRGGQGTLAGQQGQGGQLEGGASAELAAMPDHSAAATPHTELDFCEELELEAPEGGAEGVEGVGGAAGGIGEGVGHGELHGEEGGEYGEEEGGEFLEELYDEMT
ncbi:hypothetical protein QJQ45_010007 [Haematococcus lacustris]|nr:hypothetical protein QJQ45_010007 [Haematococcus lacustris]